MGALSCCVGMVGAILDWIAISSSCFMLMYGTVSVSLGLYYFTEIRRYPLLSEDTDETEQPNSNPKSRRTLTFRTRDS